MYGTLGTPASGNVPSDREQPVSWTDSKGNLWLFGGYGFDPISGSGSNLGYLNDLWEFSPATNEWAWVGGSSTFSGGFSAGVGVYGTLGTPAAGNIPPGRSGAVSWTDAKGNLWLFGGFSYSSAGLDLFNDLWEFNPSINEWAWISGSDTPNQSGVYGTLLTPAAANVPGARNMAVSWIDSNGNLWLFGGAGYDSAGSQGSLNDLWEFNPSTNQWTWVSGAKTVEQYGVPGTLHTPAPGNVPGARNGSVGWTDSNGNLWLFGGATYDVDAEEYQFGSNLNDLWEFSPIAGEWAWMGGAIVTPETLGHDESGVYGVLQMPAAGNFPGSRTGAVAWTDSKHNFWMLGGLGIDSAGNSGELNDLWEFNPSSNEWAWMGGSTTLGNFGVYGILQTPALGNAPGDRREGVGWTDSKGNLWLFGGEGFDAVANFGFLNDLWEFQPNTEGPPVTATPTFSPGSGTYTSWQTVTITDTTPEATINYIINGNTPASTYTGPITVSSSETIEAVASASGYANSNIATANYVANLPQAATPTFNLTSGTYATSQPVTISDTTPGATIYYAIGAVPTASSAVSNGPITVSAPETIEAIAVADSYLNSAVATAAYNIGSNPSAEWTWMGGSSTVGQYGWYGTLQTPAAANFPGGHTGAVGWTDNKGNLWLFGGTGSGSTGQGGYLNDLWEYNPSTAEWAWMGGSTTVAACSNPDGCGPSGVYGTLGTPAAANTPGGRESAVGWTDNKGNLWLFGGLGFDAIGTYGFLNDLWRFNPATNEWTWIAGSDSVLCFVCGQAGEYRTFATPEAGNSPGGRAQPTTWTDHNGNFWLFGGIGEDARPVECFLNDLWEFNPSTNEWAWMGGTNLCSNAMAGYPGVYGTLGVPAIGNIPWSLQSPASWTDSNGNLWLFGGIGEDQTATGYYLNDMWEYFPSINEWEWTSANSMAGGGPGIGVYGTKGKWAPGNIPGQRYASESWTDSDGNFWLLGGNGVVDATYIPGTLNDLWEFKPSINEWAWMGGSTSFYQPGVYGALGTPAPGNVPGARLSATTWTDNSGNLWLFGGAGYDAQATHGGLNDLWQYSLKAPPSVRPPSPASTPVLSLAGGTYATSQTLTISDQTQRATIYYTTNGTSPNSSSNVYQGQIVVSSSETVEAIAVASNYSVSTVAAAAYTINLPQAATPTFSPVAGTFASAQNVMISDATAGETIYYTTDGVTTPTTSSTAYTGPVPVSTTETIMAIAAASGYANSAVASAAYTINLPPTFTLSALPSSLTVNPGEQGSVTLTVTPQNGFNSAVTFACSGLPTGATCYFSPSPVTPFGSAVITQLTIAVNSGSAALHPSSRPLLPATALAAALCLFGLRRLRGARLWLLMMVMAASLSLFSGCGGGGGSSVSGGGGGSSSVTSTVTVTATSGSLLQTAAVSLTVN